MGYQVAESRLEPVKTRSATRIKSLQIKGLNASFKNRLSLTAATGVRYSASMPKFAPAFFAAALVLAGQAQAAPEGSGDTMERLLADKGLMSQIGQVGQSMRSKASELVVNAMGFLGVPYRRGGNNAETGFDCSGFVRAIYEQSVGLLLPRRAEQQAAATQRIDKSDLQPGDLVFFNTLRRTFSHVGIYVGEGRFIHSPKPGAEVRVENMGVSYWASRFDGARRVTATAADPAAVQAAPAQQPAAPSLTPPSLPAPAASPAATATPPAAELRS
jgi:cell wall-associated NlpC family hydrolase